MVKNLRPVGLQPVRGALETAGEAPALRSTSRRELSGGQGWEKQVAFDSPELHFLKSGCAQHNLFNKVIRSDDITLYLATQSL